MITLSRLLALALVVASLSAASADEPPPNPLAPPEPPPSPVPGFETAPPVTASALLSEAERKGADYTVADDVGTLRFMHVFRLDTSYGRYDVRSRRLLDIRIRETQTMASVVGMDEAPEFIRAVGGRLGQIPTAAVEIFTHPKASFQKMGQEIERAFERFKDLFDKRKRSRYEDSKTREALTGVEKRKLAADLHLDVYSSNRRVQTFLNDIATARSAGTTGIDLASYALPVVGYLAVATVRLRADVTRLLRDKTPSELEAHNDALLLQVGLQPVDRRAFLQQAWLSPRHQTVIAAATRELSGVDGVASLPRAATRARDEVGALYHEQQAVMLAHYHTRVAPVVLLDDVSHVVAARTVGDALVVIVPADQIYWSAGFTDLMKRLCARPIALDVSTKRLLVTGRVTDRATRELEALGFEVGPGYEPDSK